MDAARLAIIAGMALASYLLRAAPQLLSVVERFPDAFDRYLRYLAYALVVSIVSISLFLSGRQFDAAVARRSIALVVAVSIAALTRSAVAGMLIGTVVALLLSWLAATG
jgi:branched-subunit amino acid transport protein